jgi:hypothetical protein
MRMNADYLGVIPIEKSGPNACAGQPRRQNVFGPFELNCRLCDDRHGQRILVHPIQCPEEWRDRWRVTERC